MDTPFPIFHWPTANCYPLLASCFLLAAACPPLALDVLALVKEAPSGKQELLTIRPDGIQSALFLCSFASFESASPALLLPFLWACFPADCVCEYICKLASEIGEEKFGFLPNFLPKETRTTRLPFLSLSLQCISILPPPCLWPKLGQQIFHLFHSALLLPNLT